MISVTCNTIFLFSTIFLCSISACSALKSCGSFSEITTTFFICDGDTIKSDGEIKFVLGFFTPEGNSNKSRYVGIWYLDHRETVVWVANRDHPLPENSNGSFGNDGDGNLVLLDKIGKSYFSTKLEPLRFRRTVRLSDYGNLVVSDEIDGILWQSFDYPTDTFLPGMKMRKNLKLTSWSGLDDPSTGNFRFEQSEVGSGYVIMNIAVKHWKSGGGGSLNFTTTNKMNDLAAYLLDNYNPMRQKSNNISLNPDFNKTRLLMSSSGEIEYFKWDIDKKNWLKIWSEPQNPCSVYNACGKFGIRSSSSCSGSGVICECLHGFEPAVPENWNLSDHSGGCIRKSNLCGKDKNYTFLELKVIEVVDPDSFYEAESEENCKEACLNGNCQCQAYSYRDDDESRRYGRGSGSGRGCWIWTAELADLQVGYAADRLNISLKIPISESDSTIQDQPTGTQSRKKSFSLKVVIILITSVITVVFLLCSISCIYHRRMVAKRQESRKGIQGNIVPGSGSGLYPRQFSEEDKKSIDVPFFDLKSILAATDSFSDANKLGQGGFGPVYKGMFPGGQEIAVKRLSVHSMQGLEELKNEVVLISKLQHRNLVRLLGYCIEGDENILLYEYMPNKSLDAFIFDQTLCVLLDWEKRFEIILGIARGLLYLHQDSRLRVIHRDLKASNILLDEDMNPKISDFGLARIVGGRETEANTNRVVGTYDIFDFRFLRCKYGSSVSVIAVSSSSLFSGLCEEIIHNVSGLGGMNFTLCYSLKDGPNCNLKNDQDVALMFSMHKVVGCEFVDITVERGVVDGVEDGTRDELILEGESYGIGSFNVGSARTGRVLLSHAWRDCIGFVNQKFDRGVEDFRRKLNLYAAEMGFEFSLKKNDKERVTAECSRRLLEGCEWRVHASVCKSNGAFYIRSLNNVHTCCGRIRKKKNSMLTSKVIASLVSDEVRSNPLFSPKDIMDHIKLNYGFEVPYWSAWYGKEIARKEVLGDDVASFNRLSRYVDMIKDTNPGSYCVLDVEDSSRRFKRLFVAFGACISGFKYCRPVLCLDGTFLKNKYKGTLLVATGKNGNQGIYPLAFAIVGAENQDNWRWFVEHLAMILRDQPRNITFMSDRNHGLLQAVRNSFPGFPHGFCLHHMKMNLQSKFPGSYNVAKRDRAVWLFMRCAYAPTRFYFHQYLNELMDLDRVKIENFLSGAAFSNWANSYFEGNRYGDMCSNIAESFNSWIRAERFLPITEMVDGIRLKMMRLISVRCDGAAGWASFLCPEMEKKLVANAYLGRHFGIVKANEAEYEVEDGGKVTVNVVDGSCSCEMWRIDGFPCKHAAAVFERSGLDAYKHIEKFFWASTFRVCYSFPIHPIPDDPDGVAVVGDADYVCPPETKRQAGRPKTKRIRSTGEVARKMKCSRCGKRAGHNRKTCNEPI